MNSVVAVVVTYNRKELLQELQKEYEVVISTPFVGHEEDFAKLDFKMIETNVDRRGINPITDLKLFQNYRKLIKQENPDLVITYSIKPNIYAGLACRILNIPFYSMRSSGMIFGNFFI